MIKNIPNSIRLLNHYNIRLLILQIEIVIVILSNITLLSNKNFNSISRSFYQNRSIMFNLVFNQTRNGLEKRKFDRNTGFKKSIFKILDCTIKNY